jgi:hypothetical protein
MSRASLVEDFFLTGFLSHHPLGGKPTWSSAVQQPRGGMMSQSHRPSDLPSVAHLLAPVSSVLWDPMGFFYGLQSLGILLVPPIGVPASRETTMQPEGQNFNLYKDWVEPIECFGKVQQHPIIFHTFQRSDDRVVSASRVYQKKCLS